jgi:hypothetical protein
MEPIVWFADVKRTNTEIAGARGPTWANWCREAFRCRPVSS